MPPVLAGIPLYLARCRNPSGGRLENALNQAQNIYNKEENENMRSNTRRLASLLLAVALLFALSSTAFAAGEKPLVTMETVSSDPVFPGNQVTVAVKATAADVMTDGKLTFHYDSAVLKFVEARSGDAWREDGGLTYVVNSEQRNKVIIAFLDEYGCQAGEAFLLTFEVLKEQKTTVSLEQDGSYVSGVDSSLLSASMDLQVSCYASRFTDVDLKAYYHQGLDYVMGKGYMIGLSDTLFGPGMEANRAMIVTILYRMSGSPKVSGAMPFADVEKGRYYYDAVLWATQNGIAKGMTANTFAPTASATREQMVTFLARYAKFCGASTEVTEADGAFLQKFKDAKDVSKYAVDSMTWAIKFGVINGMSETTLVPQGMSNRAQLATIIMRFDTLPKN